MSEFKVTVRNRIKRHPERSHFDKSTVYEIIDEAMICHIGFVQEGQSFVIPTLYARRNDHLLLHGATTSRLIQYVQAGNEVSISIAIIDGIVLAKSVFNHSINYRSVVLFGKGALITDAEEKMRALEYFTERIMPGRWMEARKPVANESRATSIVSIPIAEASAKIRTGPPGDDSEDMGLPVWAGVLPVKQKIGEPITADYTGSDISVPAYVQKYISKHNADS